MYIPDAAVIRQDLVCQCWAWRADCGWSPGCILQAWNVRMVVRGHFDSRCACQRWAWRGKAAKFMACGLSYQKRASLIRGCAVEWNHRKAWQAASSQFFGCSLTEIKMNVLVRWLVNISSRFWFRQWCTPRTIVLALDMLEPRWAQRPAASWLMA